MESNGQQTHGCCPSRAAMQREIDRRLVDFDAILTAIIPQSDRCLDTGIGSWTIGLAGLPVEPERVSAAGPRS